MSTAVATITPTVATMFTREGFLWPSVFSKPAVVTTEETMEGLFVVVPTTVKK